MKIYRLADGREVFVSDGISQGTWYATYYRKPLGALKRLRSPDLPLRNIREEAQRDLDQWAAHKWAGLYTGPDEASVKKEEAR